MPKWVVNTYQKEDVPPVLDSPLEQSRTRVFCKKTGQEIDSFLFKLNKAIENHSKLEEELQRKDEIVSKFINDYRHYSYDVAGRINSDYIVILENLKMFLEEWIFKKCLLSKE